MTSRWTHLNLDAVDDAAPANGFGDRWEARVARQALCTKQTGVTHFRLRPGKRSPFSHRHSDAEEIYLILAGSGKMKLDDRIVDVCLLDAIRVALDVSRAFEAGMQGLEFIAFGPHHPGNGQPVEDDWVSSL